MPTLWFVARCCPCHDAQLRAWFHGHQCQPHSQCETAASPIDCSHQASRSESTAHAACPSASPASKCQSVLTMQQHHKHHTLALGMRSSCVACSTLELQPEAHQHAPGGPTMFTPTVATQLAMCEGVCMVLSVELPHNVSFCAQLTSGTCSGPA